MNNLQKVENILSAMYHINRISGLCTKGVIKDAWLLMGKLLIQQNLYWSIDTKMNSRHAKSFL